MCVCLSVFVFVCVKGGNVDIQSNSSPNKSSMVFFFVLLLLATVPGLIANGLV